MTTRNNDGVEISRAKAAKRLSVAPDDLDSGQWTRGRVRRLAKERPEWLTVARQAEEQRRREGIALERADMASLLEDLGYQPDRAGTLTHAEAVRLVDSAEMQLIWRWPHDRRRFDAVFDSLVPTWWPSYSDEAEESR